MSKEDLIDQSLAKELFDYNPETGDLTWKTRSSKHFSSVRAHKAFNTKFAGKSAKSLTKNPKTGYLHYRVTILGKVYQAHRVIWLWMTGKWPNGQIDHIDRNATNNCWDNLRECDQQHNSRSKSMQSNNSSGVTGVSWNSRIGAWQAALQMRGVNCHLGYFHKDDLDLAAMEVMEARIERGFDFSHGLNRPFYYKEGE